mmetsp:Transcript_16695/g.20409  ORF Transcript_16695/g.20409 Transcript_16695/m.20409 type:complete len:80 (+) Transcript_16695:273-512(+)
MSAQKDMIQNFTIKFHNALSGKRWGADTHDWIYHVGVTNLCVKLYVNSTFVHPLNDIDYKALGAKAIKNTTVKEVQFVM